MTLGALAVPDWVEPWVGVPHELNARGPEAFDCWGLVLEVGRQQFGFEAIDPGDVDLQDLEGAFELARRDWRDVLLEDAAPGDVLLFRGRGCAYHVGIVVARGLFLHTLTAGAVDRWARSPWRGRLLGAFRHDRPAV